MGSEAIGSVIYIALRPDLLFVKIESIVHLGYGWLFIGKGLLTSSMRMNETKMFMSFTHIVSYFVQLLHY